MSPKTQSDYFDSHWQRFRETDIPFCKFREAEDFLQPLIKEIDGRKSPATILDIGCGDGVHALTLLAAAGEKFVYTGLDISYNAVHKAHTLCRTRQQGQLHFIQTNAKNLCLPDKSFDIVFSYGTLYYIKEMKKAFTEMARTVKEGGLIGIWVYPERQGFLQNLFGVTRKICQRSGLFRKIIPYLLAPMLYVLPTRSGINIRNASFAQCLEVVSVNILPDNFHFSTLDTILAWFQESHLEVCFVDQDRPVTVWGRKKPISPVD